MCAQSLSHAHTGELPVALYLMTDVKKTKKHEANKESNLKICS